MDATPKAHLGRPWIPNLPVPYCASAGAPFSVSSAGQIAAGDAHGTGTIAVESAGLDKDMAGEVHWEVH
jgi:hypothetical protein